MTSANIEKSIKLKQAAKKIIHRRMLYAAGLGLIPIPIVDAAGILGIQILMIKDIAKVYEIPFKEHRVKSFIGSLAGSLGAMSAVKALPGMGSIIGAAAISSSGAASTYAIGKVFIHHFNLGGTLLNFDPVESQKYFHKLYEEGKKEAADLKANKRNKVSTLVKKMMPSKKQVILDTSITTSNKKNDLAKEEKKKKELAKAKRRKVIIAKRKKAARNRKIRRYGLLLLLLGSIAYYYFQYQMKDPVVSTDIDLFMKEAEAKQVDLQPLKDLDSLTIAEIAQFPSNATESAIAKHIQRSEATYPKRFALSAVRFNGNSDALSSGAKEQLSNIALLMKKYPALRVNLYGHTSNIGPEFNRRRVGRDRARSLQSAFVEIGISSYRITGNYIEKSAGIHDEYWGAEIVIDVSTEENAVTVEMPSLPSTTSLVPGFINNIIDKKEEEPITKEMDSIHAPTKELMIDSLESKDSIKQDTVMVLEEEPIISLDSPKIVNAIEEKIIDPTGKTESVMRQYIESENPKYPKVFTLSHVWFSGESVNLDDRAKKQLAAIAQLLQEYEGLNAAVYGYTPDTGSQEIDKKEKEKLMLKWQSIGKKRAETIRKELYDNGVSNERMSGNAIEHNKGISEPYWGAEIIIIKRQ